MDPLHASLAAPPPSALRALWESACRRPVLVVVCLAAAAYLPWLAAAPIHGTLEANRLIAAREMLRRMDWVVPTNNGEVYLKKPPFQYWLIELASAAGLPILVAGRLVSALAVIVLAALVAAFGRRTVSASVGLSAGISVLVSGIVLEKGVIAELETVLAATSTAALFAFYLAVVAERPGRWIVAGGLALGAAVLTKGPVPLVPLALGACGLALGAPARRARLLVVLASLLLVAALAALPWALAVVDRLGWQQASSIFGSESFDRLHDAGHSNSAPWWFYATGLPAALGPLCLLLPTLGALRASPRTAEVRARHAFLWCVCGSVLALSFSAAKEVRYLLPCLPAWVLLLAEGLDLSVRTGASRRTLRALVLVFRVLSWSAPLLALGYGATLPAGGPRTCACAAGGALLAARLATFVARSSRATLVASLVLALAAGKVLWAQVFLGASAARHPLLGIGAEIARQIPAGEALVMLRYDAPLHFAIDRPIRIVAGLEAESHAAGTPALVEAGQLPAPDSGWTRVASWELDHRTLVLLRAAPAADAAAR